MRILDWKNLIFFLDFYSALNEKVHSYGKFIDSLFPQSLELQHEHIKVKKGDIGMAYKSYNFLVKAHKMYPLLFF